MYRSCYISLLANVNEFPPFSAKPKMKKKISKSKRVTDTAPNAPKSKSKRGVTNARDRKINGRKLKSESKSKGGEISPKSPHHRRSCTDHCRGANLEKGANSKSGPAADDEF